MNLRQMSLACVVLAGMIALPSSAQSMKAGLWEINTKMQSDDPKMNEAMAKAQAQLAAMPPDQRKMMEDMMAKNGMSMKFGGDGAGVTMKMCVSKEMAARNEVPVRQDGNCTSTRSPMVGHTMKMSFTCTQPPSHGDGEVTFNGDNYTMKMHMVSERQNKTQTMNMNADGHFVGADCGSIKPMQMPPQK